MNIGQMIICTSAIALALLVVACDRRDGAKHSTTAANPASAAAASAPKSELLVLAAQPAQNFVFRHELPDEETVPTANARPSSETHRAEGDIQAVDDFAKLYDEGRCGEAKISLGKGNLSDPEVQAFSAHLDFVSQASQKKPVVDISRLKRLSEASQNRTLAKLAVLAEGFLSKGQVPLSKPTLHWGLAQGLQAREISEAYANGVRHSLDSVVAPFCGVSMVYSKDSNKGQSFVEALYKANQNYLEKLEAITPKAAVLSKGESETLPEFELRRKLSEAEHKKAKLTFEGDRPSIVRSLVSEALENNLPTLMLTGTAYDADNGRFSGFIRSPDGVVNFPFEIASKSGQSDRDKVELTSGPEVSLSIDLSADRELVVRLVQIRTAHLILYSNTPWRTGFYFGKDADETFKSVLKLRREASEVAKAAAAAVVKPTVERRKLPHCEPADAQSDVGTCFRYIPKGPGEFAVRARFWMNGGSGEKMVNFEFENNVRTGAVRSASVECALEANQATKKFFEIEFGRPGYRLAASYSLPGFVNYPVVSGSKNTDGSILAAEFSDGEPANCIVKAVVIASDDEVRAINADLRELREINRREEEAERAARGALGDPLVQLEMAYLSFDGRCRQIVGQSTSTLLAKMRQIRQYDRGQNLGMGSVEGQLAMLRSVGCVRR